MHVEAGMSFEPALHLGMFVRGVVIHDQMQVEIGRSLGVDLLEKLQPLLMAMPQGPFGQDFSIQIIQRREERDRRKAEDDARRTAEQAEREARKKEAAERGAAIATSLTAMIEDMEKLAADGSKDGRSIDRLLQPVDLRGGHRGLAE